MNLTEQHAVHAVKLLAQSRLQQTRKGSTISQSLTHNDASSGLRSHIEEVEAEEE